MARNKAQDLEYQIRDIRKLLNEQAQCLDFRNESKHSLIGELKDFFRKRGEIEFDYAKNLERLCERFERNTKQRNIKHEVRSTFNLWSTLLAETRRMARDRAGLAECLSTEMVARLDIMAKDVTYISRKCKELCTEVQESFMKELKELNEQCRLYQYACVHSTEALNKLAKSKEKVDAVKNSAVRKKKAEEKEKERLRQYNDQKNRLLKTRNEYLLKLASSNARSLHFYSEDVMSIIEFMDYDYHESFIRLAQAYSDAEQTSCNQIIKATNSLVDQSKTLNFENDLHYFLSEFSGIFSQPPEFHYLPFGDDDVTEYKVNLKDAFLRAQEVVKNLSDEIKTLKIQTDEDSKTIEHMSSKNLRKYKVQTIDDALGVLEEMGETIPEPASRASPLDRGSLAQTTRAVQALHSSQKGKEDTLSFTLGVFSRRLARASQLNISEAKLNIVDKSLSEQKVPPISVDGDYRIPKLFEGDCLEYIMATGSNIPLILLSCCQAILKEGLTTEGLFRIPGPAQQIEDLKKGFEEGRDPLAYSAVRNIEITAVASVLKLYFRELKNPLFPTDKYYDFIKCCRKEDPQDRLDSILETLNQLHPTIFGVMRYLFKFLYNVSQHAAETKMNSANLAVVFGPTLTRAPENSDPRLLHNDVPAINVLIQLCIERHEYLFGDETEDERLGSPPPPPPPNESMLGTSPDTAPLLMEPRPPLQQEGSLDKLEDQNLEESDINLEEIVLEDELTTSSPEEPVAVEPVRVEDTIVEQNMEVVTESSETAEETITAAEITEPTTVSILSQEEDVVVEEEKHLPPAPPDKLSSQVSTMSVTGDINMLNQALEDIESSIKQMKRPTSTADDDVPPIEVTAAAADEDDEDSDSDEEVMTTPAKALYDYNARTEKELSFVKGDVLDVIDKTRDGNWWDGMHEGKRGYIPVKYVEIAEFSELCAVPKPPERKSSIKPENDSTQQENGVKRSTVETVDEEDEVALEPEVKSVIPLPQSTTTMEPTATEEVKTNEDTVKVPEESPKRKVDVPIRSGAVSKLTQQFQQPAPPPPSSQSSSQRVLVGPHKTHTRYPSADLNKTGGQESFAPRSNSGSKQRPIYTPPPTKPKPEIKDQHSPFPLMSHDTHVSASPLQKAHLQGQVSKPQPLSNPKKGGMFRNSGKKEKPPLPSKPVPPAKGSAQLQAELASAVAAKRKKPDDAS